MRAAQELLGAPTIEKRTKPVEQKRELHEGQGMGCQSSGSHTCPYMDKIYTRRIYKGHTAT
jgi:hypothetical protein